MSLVIRGRECAVQTRPDFQILAFVSVELQAIDRLFHTKEAKKGEGVATCTKAQQMLVFV